VHHINIVVYNSN